MTIVPLITKYLHKRKSITMNKDPKNYKLNFYFCHLNRLKPRSLIINIRSIATTTIICKYIKLYGAVILFLENPNMITNTSINIWNERYSCSARSWIWSTKYNTTRITDIMTQGAQVRQCSGGGVDTSGISIRTSATT